MNRLQVLALVLGSLAMLALLSTSTRDGLRFEFPFPLRPVQIAAIAGMSIAASLSAVDLAWRSLKTGVVEHQRTPSGVAVSRTATPTFFWIHVTVLLTAAASFVWLALHVVGYGLGWWGWSIEF